MSGAGIVLTIIGMVVMLAFVGAAAADETPGTAILSAIAAALFALAMGGALGEEDGAIKHAEGSLVLDTLATGEVVVYDAEDIEREE